MFIQNDDSIVLVASCSPTGTVVPCFARLKPDGVVDPKFNVSKGAALVYGQHPDSPRATAYVAALDLQLIGGSSAGKAALGTLGLKQGDSSLASYPVAAGAASTNVIWGMSYRSSDNRVVAALETGTAQFAIGLWDFLGTPVNEFGLMGYSSGLTFDTSSSSPTAVGILNSGNFFVLGVGKTGGNTSFGIITIDSTTAAKLGGFNTPVPTADRNGRSLGFAKLADGSIVTGTGLGDRVLKFLPDGSGLDPTFSTAPLPDKSLSVAADVAGRIIVLGGANVYRLTPQGVVDPAFVPAGPAPNEPVPNIAGRRLALQKDGRIIISDGLVAVRIWN